MQRAGRDPRPPRCDDGCEPVAGVTAPDRPPETTKRRPADRRPPFSGGAEGTRTPDPFHAMEVRYQLRHSPAPARGHRPRRSETMLPGPGPPGPNGVSTRLSGLVADDLQRQGPGVVLLQHPPVAVLAQEAPVAVVEPADDRPGRPRDAQQRLQATADRSTVRHRDEQLAGPKPRGVLPNRGRDPVAHLHA